MINLPQIWLIDDDQIYSYMTKKILENLTSNVQLSTFENGEPALELLKDLKVKGCSQPDIILLDIDMPIMDGWSFLDAFGEFEQVLGNMSQIYMVTSSVNQRDVDRAKKYDRLKGYVTKPVFEDELVEILSDVYGDHW